MINPRFPARIVAGLVLATGLSLAAAEAPQTFTLAATDGRELTLPADQQGIGVYLFWASWCPYCRALMPHLQSLVDEHGDAITVYALNFRDQKGPRETIDAHGFDFVVLPEADQVAADWGVHGTPGLFLIDSRGQVRFNLYEVVTENPPGYEDLDHGQRAARRAPLWAARIREALDEILDQDVDAGTAPE